MTNDFDVATFPLGSKWVIKETDMNQKNGLAHGQTAYLIFQDPDFLSIESLQPGMPMRKVPREMFGLNFQRSLAGEIAKGYIASKHAEITYG